VIRERGLQVNKLKANGALEVSKEMLSCTPVLVARVLDKLAKDTYGIGNVGASSHCKVQKLPDEFTVGYLCHVGLLLGCFWAHGFGQPDILFHRHGYWVAISHTEVIKGQLYVPRLVEHHGLSSPVMHDLYAKDCVMKMQFTPIFYSFFLTFSIPLPLRGGKLPTKRPYCSIPRHYGLLSLPGQHGLHG